MKKLLLPTLIATLGLTGCYLPQNFDNQVQVSRSGQYQVNIDTDVIGGVYLAMQNEAKEKNKPVPEKDQKKALQECEEEFNQVIASDAKKGKHIVNSKYLGECKGHLTLEYKGNIITEKKFEAAIGGREAGFYLPVQMTYDAKSKQITIDSNTKGDRSALETWGNFQYNGKLSVKTDGKVISTNSDSKPYWCLIGSYKWDIKDFSTPNGKIVISTTGI